MAAIELIVDAYVRVDGREALEGLLDVRKHLAAQIRDRTDFNFSVPLAELDRDIAVINAGLERLANRDVHEQST